MKSMHVKQIGAITAGAAMIGAALSGAVAAGLDTTGLTKDFFYDSTYNPTVQVVVGEKGMAADAVAAGNIAAVIGNLAYQQKAKTVEATGSAEGTVTIGVSALGATGKFKQNDRSLTTLSTAFYNKNSGLTFLNETETYEKGEFVSYSLACDTQQRSEAGVLKEATYTNVHCLFCQTLCLASLENPEHKMSEKIVIDYSGMTWYLDGVGNDDTEELKLEIPKKSVSYIVDSAEIPISNYIGGTAATAVDFEWRGKFLLFGQEYYVKDLKGTDTLYLAKGKVLNDVSSEGFTSEYMGYKFKIDHLIYSQEYQVAGMVLDVEKPDGTVVQTQISKQANGIVDDIEVAGVYAEESDQVASGSLIVYDTTTNVKLEDGKDLELSGVKKDYWRVTFDVTTNTAGGTSFDTLDTTEYRSEKGDVLENITIEYRKKIILEEDEKLDFPVNFHLSFDGYRTTDFKECVASGDGEGNIKLEKDGDYQLLLSFTDDGGNRWNDVHMDQGPFSEGDRFILNGKAYEYDDAEEQTDDITMKITLKDLLQGGRVEVNLAANDGSNFVYTTIPFQEEAENADTTTIEPDTVAADSDVFNATFRSVPITYDGGEIYLAPAATASIGVNSSVFGTALSDFEANGNSMWMKIVAENGTSSGDLNDYGLASASQDTDDILVVVYNEDSEYTTIDLYDRNYNSSSDVYYDQSIAVGVYDVGDGPFNASRDIVKRLNDDKDTMLVLPEGGDQIIVDYGGDFELEGVEIVHYQDNCDATVFVGTSQEATLLESTITEADVGTTKVAGCCTFEVKDFSVSGAGATAATTDTTVNPIVGNLVVPESGANVNKNLVVVGGPAVNGMTTVTADEIASASQKYIVKKSGKKLVVAGWTAADTVDAGNALINWLKANVH